MENIAPIIILAPSPRAGTTLIQRLICSSENAIIYGDPVGQEIEFLVAYAETKKDTYSRSYSPAINASRASVIERSDRNFIASLMPESSRICDAFDTFPEPWIRACVEDAQAAGRALWGWKVAGINPFAVSILPKWFPAARFITVSRDLEEVVRSAKADGHFHCEAGLRQFCDAWLSGGSALKFLTANHGERVLTLNYSDMITDQRGTVSMLEEFTSARHIKQDVFQRKINNHNPDIYLAPAVLTTAEQEIVEEYQTANSRRAA